MVATIFVRRMARRTISAAGAGRTAFDSTHVARRTWSSRQVPGSSTTSPSAVSRPPSRRSQIMSQWTALSFVPPVSG